MFVRLILGFFERKNQYEVVWVGREMRKIWEQPGEGKKHEQHI